VSEVSPATGEPTSDVDGWSRPMRLAVRLRRKDEKGLDPVSESSPATGKPTSDDGGWSRPVRLALRLRRKDGEGLDSVRPALLRELHASIGAVSTEPITESGEGSWASSSLDLPSMAS